ncbi:MAG: 7-cyano-7-deazaguanine synthase [Planctomycetota bacterium]|nr:MAG: 7-cyano-7-deazaguanine synthase [Planctomycetota bacterium]
MTTTSQPAVVLLSGGLDSAVTCALAAEQGFRIHALTVDYGQRHDVEIAAARRVATAMCVARHVTQRIDLRAFGGSALTTDLPVPAHRPGEASPDPDVPVTYVPARNTILLSFALAFAEVTGASDIFIGVNAVDYSGYPDCRPAFIEQFERLARVATRAGVEGRALCIRAPLMHLNKAQIVLEGVRLGVDLGMTHSCYDPDAQGRACGRCDSCHYRREGFHQAGVPDPTVYRS